MRTLVPFSIRFGKATNSSSTHSIVFWPGAKDVLVRGEYSDIPEGIMTEFGWDHFVLASDLQKRLYVAVTLLDNWHIERSYVTAAAACALAGLPIKYAHVVADGYVDHQSVIAAPGSASPDIEKYAEELLAFIMRPNVVILGGNDNEEDPFCPPAVVEQIKIPAPVDNDFEIMRRDPAYGFWTTFNPRSGNRVRFRWSDGPVPDRASLPELVDLKITDHCTSNCNFCYQDSSYGGKHSDFDKIRSILRGLKEMQVFEVVLGGGEPTSHPQFAEIIKAAKNEGLEVSFTTNNPNWLREEENRKLVQEHVSAVGLSEHYADLIWNNIQTSIEAGIQSKTVIHLIPELMKKDELERVLKMCDDTGTSVLLLGLKQMGRAKNIPIPEDRSWLQALENRWFGIDTAFASRYQVEIRERNIHKAFYDTQDGRWSMYIDAVELKAGPSSYCDPEEMKPFTVSWHDQGEALIQVYRSWNPIVTGYDPEMANEAGESAPPRILDVK